MVKSRKLSPLPILDEASLDAVARAEGIKSIHVKKVLYHAVDLIRRKYGDLGNSEAYAIIEDVPGIPKRFSAVLRDRFSLLTSRVVEKQHSSDGTVKLLIQLQDGLRVESVIIPHRNDSGNLRNTLCVSSQVGCQMRCTFCATGTMGLKGDLLGGEILEQMLHASMILPIRNVVFMGMGEPLNNYEAVMNAIRGMRDPKLFKISPKHITLSTVGVVPMIYRLTRDAPETQLALSLHAPNQELRNSIVPSANAFPLSSLLAALDNHISYIPKCEMNRNDDEDNGWKCQVLCTNQIIACDELECIKSEKMKPGKKRALIEYVMLSGVNDTEQCAHELGSLLSGRPLIVNLIPYNAALNDTDPFREPTETDLTKFRDIIVSYGLFCTIRRHHGRDIDGACGQLALKNPSSSTGSNVTGVRVTVDIEDIGTKRTSFKAEVLTHTHAANGPDAAAGSPYRPKSKLRRQSTVQVAKIVIGVGGIVAVALIGKGLKQRMTLR